MISDRKVDSLKKKVEKLEKEMEEKMESCGRLTEKLKKYVIELDNGKCNDENDNVIATGYEGEIDKGKDIGESRRRPRKLTEQE